MRLVNIEKEFEREMKYWISAWEARDEHRHIREAYNQFCESLNLNGELNTAHQFVENPY